MIDRIRYSFMQLTFDEGTVSDSDQTERLLNGTDHTFIITFVERLVSPSLKFWKLLTNIFASHSVRRKLWINCTKYRISWKRFIPLSFQNNGVAEKSSSELKADMWISWWGLLWRNNGSSFSKKLNMIFFKLDWFTSEIYFHSKFTFCST